MILKIQGIEDNSWHYIGEIEKFHTLRINSERDLVPPGNLYILFTETKDDKEFIIFPFILLTIYQKHSNEPYFVEFNSFAYLMNERGETIDVIKP